MAWSAASPGARQPDNTAFTQQRLPAWQPLLSAGIVLPLFLCAGLAFIGLGLGLYYSSNGIKELEYDYTGAPGNCSACAAAAERVAPPPAGCRCRWCFSLPELFQGPVFLYYELSNFYQNYRRYVVSRDDEQLSGLAGALRHPANECAPYQLSGGLPVAPCGAIANSLFNDSFRLLHRRLPGGAYAEVPLDRAAIAWWTDYHVKFRNPQPVNGSLRLAFRGTAKPPNWPRPAYALSPDPNNTGFVNQDFVVWMRTAALPTFRKLYARVRRGDYSAGLPRGAYCLSITYNYPVLAFGGRKRVILSSVSWMGGKNPFLGIAYLAFGSLCVVTGLVMLVVYIRHQDENGRGDEEDD
ncbi:cell cycle control protein 50B [Macrotis lagotis]|uniref:cell cycle control protein 50B n=1 Tax=Macrotis lagotis TaxID=92651 RepID=UPI003D69359C